MQARRCAFLILLVAGRTLGSAAEEPASTTASTLAAKTCLAATSRAKVSEIVDARSLRLEDGRTIHLAGIEPFGLLQPDTEKTEAELKSRLTELAEDKAIDVQIVAPQPDRYGRQAAMVAVDGSLLQETLAREGLAVAFGSGAPLPCFDKILAAEAEARRGRRGFWTGERLPYARADALAPRIGHFAIFEGRVISVGNRRARTYLNFGGYWSEDVTAEILAEDRERFGGEAVLAALAGHRVRVRGFLEQKSGPMVVLRSSMQLEVLDFATGTDGIAP